MPENSEIYHKEEESNYKFIIIAIISGLLALFILIFALNYFKILSISKMNPALFGWLPQVTSIVKPSISNTNNAISTPSAINETTLPVSENSKSVSYVGVAYGFKGTIVSVINNPDSNKIFIDANEKGMPAFFSTTKDTPIVFREVNNKETAAKMSDLKNGQKISIDAFYGLKIKSWKVNKVAILI